MCYIGNASPIGYNKLFFFGKSPIGYNMEMREEGNDPICFFFLLGYMKVTAHKRKLIK